MQHSRNTKIRSDLDEEDEMFLNSQVIEEDVVLGTQTKAVPNTPYVFQNVVSIYYCCSGCRRKET